MNSVEARFNYLDNIQSSVSMKLDYLDQISRNLNLSPSKKIQNQKPQPEEQQFQQSQIIDSSITYQQSKNPQNRNDILYQTEQFENQKLQNEIENNATPGKRLDFICQEMNREINTIGSKNQFIEIAEQVINAKDALENIREQSKNIE